MLFGRDCSAHTAGLAFAAMLLLAVQPACGGGEEADGGKLAGGACDKNGATGDLEESLTVAGKERGYFVHIPSEAARTSVALVFAFHGSGGTGKRLRDSLELEQHTKADAIVVYPDASGGLFDIDAQTDNADIAFFDALVEKLEASHCITKVFATGFSRGAYFTNHLACYRGDKLAAIASHGGGGPFSAPFEKGVLQCPSAPTASLVVHGLDDKTVPPSEGKKSIDHWTRTLGCGPSTEESAPSPCVRHDGCKKPLEVCNVAGLGHSVWDEGVAKTWSFFQAAP